MKEFFILILTNAIFCSFNFLSVDSFTQNSYTILSRFYSNKSRFKRDVISKTLQPPKIVIDIPQYVNLNPEYPRLTCKAIGNPTPKISWFVGQYGRHTFSEIVDNERYIVHREGTLEFIGLIPPDAYYCLAKNVLGSVFSRKSIVQRVHIPKDLIIKYESLEVNRNEKAVISCNLSPTIFREDIYLRYWEIKMKNWNEKIMQINETSGRYSVISSAKSLQLHIRNVTMTDFNEMQARCVLGLVNGPDFFLETDLWTSPKESIQNYHTSKVIGFDSCLGKDIRVLKGSTVELPWCSKPTTERIIWYKSESTNLDNGERLNLNGSKYRMIDERFGNLLIRNVDITEEGSYFVKSNGHPFKFYTPFNLRVTVNLGIEIKPNVSNAYYGELIELQCTVTGYPPPIINWFLNSRDLGLATVSKITPTIWKTSLKFNATIDAVGVYQCVAESRDSTDSRMLDNAQHAAQVIISVMIPKLVSQFPPKAPQDLYSTAILETDTSVVNIQCTFNSVPEATIVWYLDDEPIPIVDCLMPNMIRKDPFTVEYSLQIDLGKLSSIGDKWLFGGKYWAEASNQHGKAQCSTMIYLTNVFRIRHPKDKLFLHGQSLSLKCYVISESHLEIIWSMTKNGKIFRLPDNHLQAVSADTREFTIQKLDKNVHQGIYTCLSSYKNKEISHNFTISIAKPPLVLHEFPEQIFVSELSEFSIYVPCIPRQKPDQPWYAWFEFLPYKPKDPKNQVTVIKILQTRQTNINGITGEYLKVSEVTSDSMNLPLPEGVPEFMKSYPNNENRIWISTNSVFHLSNITCAVSNHAGTIRKSARITIVNIAFENTPPPEKEVILGDSFILNCSAKPNQLKTITIWQYSKGYQTESFVNVSTLQSSRIYQLFDGKLIVKNIKLTDPQRFMCLINSSIIYNGQISKVVKILIKVPATIKTLANTIELELFKEKSVACVIHGDKDDLNIKWYKKENEEWKEILENISIDNHDEAKKLTQVNLYFYKVENIDEGLYKCVARNSFNKQPVEHLIILKVVDVPGPVKINVNTINALARSIYLGWTAPVYNGKMPIYNYVVTYSTGNKNWTKTTNHTEIKLQFLRPHQSYKITVRAVNKVGIGVENGTIQVTTRQAVPDGPVLDLSAVSISSTCFRIKWNSPDQLVINGNIKHYQLCYLEIAAKKTNDINLDQLSWPSTNETLFKIKDMNKQFMIGHCKAVNDTELLISDLSKFTEYVFRVVVVNEAGPGPAAYVKARTKEDYPDRAPTQVTCTCESKRLFLEWNPPPRSSINGVLKGYKIVYFRIDQQGEPDHVEDSSPETKHTLDRLLPNTNYSIQVKVVNKQGLGPPSDIVHCVTSEAAPSAPNNIKAFFINDSCAIVSWTKPTEPNGKINEYRIQISEKRIDQTISIPSKSDNRYFKHVICGVKLHLLYKVSVVAYTKYIGTANNTTIIRIDPNSARILSFSTNIVSGNFSTVFLDCESVPDYATKNWMFPGSADIKEYSNGTLVIHRLTSDNEGIYTCSVDNNKDSIHYNVSMQPVSHGVPGVPKIDFFNVSANSLFISWRSTGSPRENDPITSFIVRTTDFNNNSTREQEVSRTLRALRVLHLDCGSKYKLEIFAKNLAGNSSPGMIQVRTRGTKPIIPDTKLIVMSKNPKSMCFNLEAFLPGQGCPAHRFKVTVKPTNQGRLSPSSGVIERNITRTNSDDNLCYNVTDLHPDTDYYYEIEAFNRNGSVKAEGHVKTLAFSSGNTPTMTSKHNQPYINFQKYSWIFISVIILIILVIVIALFFYCVRKSFKQNLHPTLINNQIPNNPLPTTILQPTPAPMRNRKLPTPPENNNVYHKGISEPTKPDDDEDDEMLKPYATYESATKLDPMTSRNLPGRNIAPYTGSQAHSYQYPDMMDSQQHMMPADSSSAHKAMTYENDLKQPLLNQSLKVPNRPYDKGYSTGESRPTSTLRPQNVRVDPNPSLEAARMKGRGLPMVSASFAESEAYRPSSSLCSSNTESSTKEELLRVFHNKTSSNQFASRLQERDEDGTSTARDNRSTIINRSRHINNTLSDDSMQPDSYCESGSSGDDFGIINFTAEPPGQQVIMPISKRLCHQNTSVTSVYDAVDRPQMIHSSNTFNFTQSRNPLPEEDEEEDANNYTNNFVVV